MTTDGTGGGHPPAASWNPLQPPAAGPDPSRPRVGGVWHDPRVLRLGPLAVSALGWTVGAVTSVAIGLIALSMIGTGLSHGPLQPLSPNALTRTADPDPGTPTPGPSPTPSPHDHPVTAEGGTAVFRCVRGSAYLATWIPAPGYRADGVLRGPASLAGVRFEGARREVAITARCVAGVVQATVREERSADD